MEIMHGVELRRKDFTGKIEMAQIGAGEVATAVALAGLIDWPRIARELGPLDAELSLEGKESASTGVSGGKDAIEEVVAAPNGKDQILRFSDPHEIAGPLLG